MRRLRRFEEVDLAQKLEGIRFALLSVQRAFVRIESFCRGHEGREPKDLTFFDCFDLLCDCWQVIDGADRARFLVESVPRWEREKAGRRAFTKSMAKVREFRNLFHHFGSKAASLPEKSSTVMGSLSWQRADNPLCSMSVLIDSGAIESSIPSLTYDRVERRFVADFMFSVADSQISLAEVSVSCKEFWIVLDKMFQDAGVFDDGDAGAMVFSFDVRSVITDDQTDLVATPQP
jgi:hypothetical protein